MPTKVLLYISVHTYILGSVPVERWFAKYLSKGNAMVSIQYPGEWPNTVHLTPQAVFEDPVTKETLAKLMCVTVFTTMYLHGECPHENAVESK